MLALSGGKDSISTAILDHFWGGHKIDELIYVEVMYDLKRNISAEKLMADGFIRKKAKPLFESWGYKFTILRSTEDDFLSYFNHRVTNARNPENEGKKAGFPIPKLCSIKRDCKEKVMRNYLHTLQLEHERIVQYVGICIDEPERLESLYKCKDKVSLLAEYEYTQLDSRALAEQYDLLSPTYDLSGRGGCFFCCWSKQKEHSYMKEYFPEIWEEFVSLEDEPDLVASRWNLYGKTLKELDSLI